MSWDLAPIWPFWLDDENVAHVVWRSHPLISRMACGLEVNGHAAMITFQIAKTIWEANSCGACEVACRASGAINKD